MSEPGDNPADCAAELVQVSRGPLTESRHRGHLVAVDPFDKTVAALGLPDTITYLRSSGKAFQALPVVALGAADAFHFTEQEIAIACGSHNGEPIHVETVRSMLEKVGLDESALKCGAHEPYSVDIAQELIRNGESPTPIQNNCSGKHAAMLALAKHLGAPTESYDQFDHAVQQSVLQTVAEFSGVLATNISIGIDGCGVPVYGISVRAMALMYARLIHPPPEMAENVRTACKRIVQAMIDYPVMIGGTKDRLDTELIRAGGGRLISKIGAEGVYTVGVLPSKQWPNGLGLALKIEDGDDRRARPAAVIDALRQLGVLSQPYADQLAKYSPSTIINRCGDVVGEVRAAFTLSIQN